MRMRIDMNANVLAQTVKPNRFIKMSVRWESILFGSLLLLLAKNEYITVCLSNIHMAWVNNHGASYHFIFVLLLSLIICISLWLCHFSTPTAHSRKAHRLALISISIGSRASSICASYIKRNQLVGCYVNSVYSIFAALRAAAFWWVIKYWLCRLSLCCADMLLLFCYWYAQLSRKSRVVF